MKFYYGDVDRTEDYGPCGKCKACHIRSLRNNYEDKIHFVDGPTDQCIVKLTDFYAREELPIGF